MDTIVAVSTPPGRSAIAVVRLSGPLSLRILQTIVKDDQFTPEPQRVTLKKIWREAEILDEALVTYFRAPHSFSGEDMVEISCHGAPIILRGLLDLLQLHDARLAEPGEFTLRACRNGKMNLTQAEAIRDLINAQTQAAAAQASRQMQGELSEALGWTKQELIRVIVILESAIEFVEDDLPAVQVNQIAEAMEKVTLDLARLGSTYGTGHLLRDGLRVTIVGRPNVGKSSIFNRLLRMERAIVTDVAGTTRDSLTESISLNGVPISLTDTAGFREAGDKIEAIGIERTRRAMADADLLIAVIDGSSPLQQEDFEMLDTVRDRCFVVAINKNDLPADPTVTSYFNSGSYVQLSALRDDGISALTAAILKPFGSNESSQGGFVITDSRHYDLLRRAQESVTSAMRALKEHAGEELVVADLHNALRLLGSITGETTTDEILGEIFSTFCIGK